MKKVLFVHDGPIYKDTKNNFFGIDYNTDLKNRYLYLGNKVTFLMRVKEVEKNMKLSRIEGNDFDVVSIPDFKSILKHVKYKKKAEKIIENEVTKHDLLVIRLPSFIGLLAYKYAKKYNKDFIIELVACPWDGYINHSFSGKVIAPSLFLKTKKIVRNSPYVAYVSSDFLQRRYPTKGKQLNCSDVILSKPQEKILLKRIEKIENMKKNKPIVIGTVGAVNMSYKGQQYVIKAMKALIEEGYRLEYQLVGGGDSSFLKQLAKRNGVEDHVKFIGALPHKEVSNFMENIDIYIQPSNVESHGRVIVEAFNVACPVIGSSTGGIPELVNSEYVFKRKNVKDLINKMKIMIESDLSASAKQNFRKASEFQLENLTKKRNEYYDIFLRNLGE